MFHCNGWGGVFAMTAPGWQARDPARHRRRRDHAASIADEGVTFACMAPAVLRTILDTPDKERFDVKHEAAASPSRAPRRPPPSSSASRRSWAGSSMQIYGLTETAPLLTISKPRRELRRGRLGAAVACGRGRDRRRPPAAGRRRQPGPERRASRSARSAPEATSSSPATTSNRTRPTRRSTTATSIPGTSPSGTRSRTSTSSTERRT